MGKTAKTVPAMVEENVVIMNEDSTLRIEGLDKIAGMVQNNAITSVVESNDNYTAVQLFDTVTLSNGTVTDSLKVRESSDIELIRTIQGYQRIGKISAVRISSLFAKLIDGGFIDRHGTVFKGIGDLGSKLFGFKSATASVYYGIGKTFFDSEGNAILGLFADMSIGQLQELTRIRDNDGKIDIESVKNFISESGINEYTKTAVIRQKIYDLNYATKKEKAIADKNAENTPAENTPDENTPTENTPAENTPAEKPINGALLEDVKALIMAKSPVTISIIQTIGISFGLDVAELQAIITAQIVADDSN